jgi:hypothetical protein
LFDRAHHASSHEYRNDIFQNVEVKKHEWDGGSEISSVLP